MSADCFALGAILCFLFTGEDPYIDPDSPIATAINPVEAWLSSPPRASLVPFDVRQLAVALTDPDPSQRPSVPSAILALKHLEKQGDPGSRPSRRQLDASALAELQPLPDATCDRIIGDALGAIRSSARALGNRFWPATTFGMTTDPRNVQHGAAGVIGALVQWWKCTGDDSVLDLVSDAVAWLAARVDTIPFGPVGLHFGAAGQAWALCDAGRALGDDGLVDQATELALRLPPDWPGPDVTHGRAGLGLALLHIHELTGDSRLLVGASRCADSLVRDVERTSKGLVVWRTPSGFHSNFAGRTFYGFAHGTAGIATFLLAMVAADGREDCRAVVCEAAAALAESCTRRDDLIGWGEGPDTPPAVLPHWCNGASGIGSFMLRWWRESRDQSLIPIVEGAARAVMATKWRSGIAYCHGLAGNGDFLLDASNLFRQDHYRLWAADLASVLFERRVIQDGLCTFGDQPGARTPDFNVGVAGVLSFFVRLRHGAPGSGWSIVTLLLDNPGASVFATRLSWRFAGDGLTVVCTVVPASGPAVLEVSRSTPGGPTGRTSITVPYLGPHSQLLPISRGRILVCHHHDGGQQVDLVTPGRRVPSVRRLLTAELPSLRLVAMPPEPAGGLDHATKPGAGLGRRSRMDRALAVAVSTTEDARSAIWALTEDGVLRSVCTTPGIFTGGIWLDGHGRRLGGEVTADGHPCNGVAIDLATGSCETVLSLSRTSNDRLVACCARAGVLVISTDLTGEVRLGVGRPDDGPIGFPPALHRTGHEVRLVALDGDGRRLLVAYEVGAASLLSVYDRRSGLTAGIEAPAGVAIGAGVLGRSCAHFVHSTPSRPAAVATVRRQGTNWSMAEDALTSSEGAPPVFARPLLLSGADGPVEAVSYGQPYQADQLVIALHGGPLDAWRLRFDPLLHTLAANGIAVVAPNQRGSTHYGVEHALAIRGRWGGPDLDDVLAITRSLLSDRGASATRPILVGTSYGAFLALLAAAASPSLWSGCVALSPFLSGPRLYPEAGTAIRALVERLGGLALAQGDDEAPDVLERCQDITAPVLLVHGTNDDVIPVGQSRLLYERLVAQGRTQAELLEIPGEGHDVAGGRHRGLVVDRVLRFCRKARSSSSTSPTGPNPPYEPPERR